MGEDELQDQQREKDAKTHALVRTAVSLLERNGVKVEVSTMYGERRGDYVCLHLVNVAARGFAQPEEEK